MTAETERAAAGPAEHAVQFYGSEDELADRVSGYLGAALAAGETAIAVATPAHRRAFEARLAVRCDLEAARVRGSYIALNAAELMRLVLIGSRPDPPSLDLEVLWNRLSDDRLSSLCGYPAPLVSGPRDAAALRELCALHTAVDGLVPPA
jgi:hypothetical protein